MISIFTSTVFCANIIPVVFSAQMHHQRPCSVILQHDTTRYGGVRKAREDSQLATLLAVPLVPASNYLE